MSVKRNMALRVALCGAAYRGSQALAFSATVPDATAEGALLQGLVRVQQRTQNAPSG